MGIDGIGALRRSLPALIHLLLVPVGPGPSTPIAVEGPVGAEPPAERVTALSSQFTAGVRGSRAPPVASL